MPNISHIPQYKPLNSERAHVPHFEISGPRSLEKFQQQNIKNTKKLFDSNIDMDYILLLKYCSHVVQTYCSYLISSRIAMAKATFNKKNLFTSKLDLNLRMKLVKCLSVCPRVLGTALRLPTCLRHNTSSATCFRHTSSAHVLKAQHFVCPRVLGTALPSAHVF